MANISVGDNAPGFTLPSDDGKQISLADFRGKTLVLYFYPKDDTSGCTKEACSFRDNMARLRRKGAEVLGISADPPASHEKFIRKYDLPFSLASDEKKSVLRAYGVWTEKSMYGRKFMGIERSTFIIDPKGIVRHIFRKVKVEGHVDEVLALL